MHQSCSTLHRHLVLDVETHGFGGCCTGANYLSGGQTLEQAAARLSAINQKNTKGPWNLSFSWSQALQLPLLDLCKDAGELKLDEMAKLYVEELKIASAAAKGEYEWVNGDGDHVGKAAKEAVVA